MKSRAGMTLVEVVASLLIISLIVSTCIPFIRKIAALGERQAGLVDADHLRAVTDDFLSIPREPGFEIIPSEGTIPSTAIRFRRLDATEGSDHFWILFEHEASAFVRWVPSSEGDG